MTDAKTLLLSPPSFYQLYKRFDSVSKVLTLFLIFYFVFNSLCFLQVAEFCLPSLLCHHPLPGSGPLRLLYVGVWSAVSPVRLECVLSQVVV